MSEIRDGKAADLQLAVKELQQNNYSCVLCIDGNIYASEAHGVKPLLSWAADPNDYTGCCAADRVVGRAAALLYAKIGASAVYAELMSEKALPVFERFKISVTAARTVPYIINRAGDDMCPMEKTVLQIDDPDEAERALLKKLAELSGKA